MNDGVRSLYWLFLKGNGQVERLYLLRLMPTQVKQIYKKHFGAHYIEVIHNHAIKSLKRICEWHEKRNDLFNRQLGGINEI